MSTTGLAVPDRSECIRTYLRAKDQNRPHLMKSAFADSARLEVRVATDAISFPPVTSGLDAITQVLVRDFGCAYENVYTFCLSSEPKDDLDGNFNCRWLVGMSEKATGSVRVGCGNYDWSFQLEEPKLADSLVITIKTMKILPPERLQPVMTWLTALPYPWCSVLTAIGAMPELSELADVRGLLALS
jgi:hypothetical protein